MLLLLGLLALILAAGVFLFGVALVLDALFDPQDGAPAHRGCALGAVLALAGLLAMGVAGWWWVNIVTAAVIGGT